MGGGVIQKHSLYIVMPIAYKNNIPTSAEHTFDQSVIRIKMCNSDSGFNPFYPDYGFNPPIRITVSIRITDSIRQSGLRIQSVNPDYGFNPSIRITVTIHQFGLRIQSVNPD